MDMEMLHSLIALWPFAIAIGLVFAAGNLAKRMADDNRLESETKHRS